MLEIHFRYSDRKEKHLILKCGVLKLYSTLAGHCPHSRVDGGTCITDDEINSEKIAVVIWKLSLCLLFIQIGLQAPPPQHPPSPLDRGSNTFGRSTPGIAFRNNDPRFKLQTHSAKSVWSYLQRKRLLNLIIYINLWPFE